MTRPGGTARNRGKNNKARRAPSAEDTAISRAMMKKAVWDAGYDIEPLTDAEIALLKKAGQWNDD